jgi:aldose sugar dehydrogenase
VKKLYFERTSSCITMKQPMTFLFASLWIVACSSSVSTQTDFTYFPTDLPKSDLIRSEKQNFHTQVVAKGLKNPWGMAFLPDGRVLVTERPGTLRMIENGRLLDAPVSGVPEVVARGQGGLLDVALHPQFETNSFVYLSYSIPLEGGTHTGIMRAKLDGNALTEQTVIFTGGPASTRGHHFGSRIVFDNDGYLYFTIGDRGRMQDAQVLTNAAGKVFRIHDDGRIPEDNPFVGQEGVFQQIWSYGHRNIQGFVKHPETGVLWSHEHGPRGGDELNIVKKAANYGWPTITYGINYDGSIITNEREREGMEQPQFIWDPSIGPSGLAFVTSDIYPGWKGNAMVGALAFTSVYRVEIEGSVASKQEQLLANIGRVRDVRQAPDGYLYVIVESSGEIIRLLPE